MTLQLPRIKSIYKPLSSERKEIRLLTLHPGARNDPIQCSLAIHSIEDAVPFTALSYEWGDTEYREDIEIDGHMFQVMPNLHACLLEIRDVHTPRTFWIDAMCIDQKDDTERGHKVALMARIYSTAKDVVAWLGPAADRSDEVMDLLALFPSGVLELHGGISDQNRFFLALCQRRLCLAFCYILERSYWSRLWMLQEVVLAKVVEVRCGTRVVNLDSLWWFAFEKNFDFRVHSLWRRPLRALPARWSPDLDEIPAIKGLIPNHYSESGGEEVPRERLFSAFSSKDYQPLYFTISRLAVSDFWEVELLESDSKNEYASSDQPLQLSSWGCVSFGRGPLLLDNISHENVREITQEVITFYHGTVDPKASAILCHRYLNHRQTFEDLIWTARQLQCKDVRDRVFGLLGLISGSSFGNEHRSLELPDFSPQYSWTPMEMLWETLKYFKPEETIKFANSVAGCLGLYDKHPDDPFIQLQSTLPFCERVSSIVTVSAVLEAREIMFQPISGFDNLYGMDHTKDGRFEFCLYLPNEDLPEERFFFNIHYRLIVLAIRKAGSNETYQCVGIGRRFQPGRLQVPSYAAFFEKLAEYIPVITISCDLVPSHWKMHGAAVKIPFLCFQQMLTERIF